MSRMTSGEYDPALSEALAAELGAVPMRDVEGVEVAWIGPNTRAAAIARLRPAYERTYGTAPAALGVYKHSGERVGVSMGPKP